MGKQIDLNALSLVELRELQGAIPGAIHAKEQAEKAEVMSELRKLASSRGFDVNSLFGGAAAGKKARTPAAVKYRHPENADLTWTGRGRQPKWVETLLASGKTLEDLKV